MRASAFLDRIVELGTGVDHGPTVEDGYAIVADCTGSEDAFYAALASALRCSSTTERFFTWKGEPPELLRIFNAECDEGQALTWDDLDRWGGYDEAGRSLELKIDSVLDLLFGVEWIEFSDAMERCTVCHRFVPTIPDSYFDADRYVVYPDHDTAELVCHECTAKNPEEHLTRYIEWLGTTTPVPFILDPVSVGFELVGVDKDGFCNRFQRGLHQDMTDDYEGMVRLLKAAIDDRFILKVYPSQFYGEWEVYAAPEVTAVAKALAYDKALLWKANNRRAGDEYYESCDLVVTPHIIRDRVAYREAFFRVNDEIRWKYSSWPVDNDTDLWPSDMSEDLITASLDCAPGNDDFIQYLCYMGLLSSGVQTRTPLDLFSDPHMCLK